MDTGLEEKLGNAAVEDYNDVICADAAVGVAK